MIADSRAVAGGLFAWSDGMSLGTVAAVDLLIDHGVWLTRGDFLDRCVTPVPESGLYILDWEAVTTALDTDALIGTGSELGILRLVASLGCGHPVDLGEALSSLDSTNAARAVQAVFTAAGVQ